MSEISDTCVWGLFTKSRSRGSYYPHPHDLLHTFMLSHVVLCVRAHRICSVLSCCVNIVHIFLCIFTFLVLFSGLCTIGLLAFSVSPCHRDEHHDQQSVCSVCMRVKCVIITACALYSCKFILYFGFFCGCSVTVSGVSKALGTFSRPVGLRI